MELRNRLVSEDKQDIRSKFFSSKLLMAEHCQGIESD